MLEFKINKYITLKLENGKTNIYVNGVLFNQCKYIVTRKKINDLQNFLEIETVDELLDEDLTLDHSFEKDERTEIIDIPIETRFWVHCSNLQIWAEENYNSRLLHRNLAFPLLKKLANEGDTYAKQIFKEEIVKRYRKGNKTIREFLKGEEYIEYLDENEKRALLINKENIILQELEDKFGIKPMWTNELKNITDPKYHYKILYYVEDQNIIGIKMNYLNMEYVSEMITSLKHLKVLELVGNKLKNIPKFVKNFMFLEKLNLEINNIKEIPKFLQNFPNLKKLNLSYNNINSIPEFITQLDKIEEINLYKNQIMDIPKNLKKNKNLRIIY